MLLPIRSLAAPFLLATAAAGAQVPEPVAVEAERAASAAAAASSAAMERARRQAAGPMRFILEASRNRRRAAEAEPPAAAEATSVRAISSRQDRAASPAPIAAAALVQASAAAPAPSAGQDTALVVEITLDSWLTQADAAAAAPALSSSVAPFVSPLAGTALALPEIGAGPVRPRLASKVDLDVPQQVLDEMGPNAVVPIDITIRANGTVALVALAGPAPRRLLRAVQAAVEQWRFDPLPGERIHRVELVFNLDR